MSKATQREIRRQARLARQRRQRNIIIVSVAGVVILIAALAAISINNQNANSANATATAAALASQSTAQPTANSSQTATEQAFAASIGPMTFPGANISDTVKTASGLQYKDLTVGTGAEAKPGNTVSVHYTGWLTDGTKFDSSVDRGQPFSFQLGAGRVIKGWDEGVAGMKVGGRRILIIPPDLGYGSQANGSIPANSTLIFEVVLIGVH